MSQKAVIREGKKEDCKEITRLIQEMAVFEKMPDSPRVSEEQLMKDGFETQPPLYYSLVVEDPKVEGKTKKLIGYAVYYFGYSTWSGKKLYLEDIFITEEYRKKGLGKDLFQRICQEAEKTNCEVMYFTCLKWNPASNFYKSFGCEDITESKQWHFYTLEKPDLIKAAHS